MANLFQRCEIMMLIILCAGLFHVCFMQGSSSVADADAEESYLCENVKICRHGDNETGEVYLINGTEHRFKCDLEWEPFCVHMLTEDHPEPSVFCLESLGQNSTYNERAGRCELIPLKRVNGTDVAQLTNRP